MTERFDIIVIGAGPAGAAAAITAARGGMRVLLLERGSLPRQRVCGEFVSPEALDLLRGYLNDTALVDNAERIERARIFVDTHLIKAPVSPAGASITRYDLDFALWEAAMAAGVTCRMKTFATHIRREAEGFVVESPEGPLRATHVVNASGRWSNLSDWREEEQRSQWIGLKAHYFEEHPPDSVDLYFFDGGYCGVQRIAPGKVNVASMVRASVATTLDEVFSKHAALYLRSRQWQRQSQSFSTAPLVFRDPEPVHNGVLNAGDAAAFIDPFVGDGISLALHSGRMAAEAILSGAGAEGYAKTYDDRLQPAFLMAERLRALMALPRAVRHPFLHLMRLKPVAALVVRATRARV